jgi:DNA-binding response OmpR family regulator
MKLLIIEDERKLSDNISDFLKGEGYSVDAAFDGEEGLDLALERSYDCIILDILLPGMDGLSLCRFLREEIKSTVPILMLTALGELDNRIEGLNAGADDYLPKPFDLHELLARIKALLRRANLRGGEKIACGELLLDSRKQTVLYRERPIELSAREFSILELLMRNPGMVFTREEITDKIWESGYEPRSNIVDVYIRYIRKKLEALKLDHIIETVQGRGYRLREEP